MDTDIGGASRFWTSDQAPIVEARRLVLAGSFSDAEKALRPLAAAGDKDADAGLQMIAWVRRDYSLDAAGMLAQLVDDIPGVTAEDVERWRAAGELQNKVIDGQVRFFRAEPTNLFRFSKDAIARRKPPADTSGQWNLEKHMVRVIAEAEKSGRADVVPIRHRVTYTVTVNADAPGVVPGATLRAWLPYPQTYRQQTPVYLTSTTPSGGRVAPAGEPHATVYFERKVGPTEADRKFSVSFEFGTSAFYPNLDGAVTVPSTDPAMAPYLVERAPHVLFTPEVKAAVAEAIEIGAKDDPAVRTDPLAKARSFYRWIQHHIAYRIEDEYGTIPSITRRVLDIRRGDCGVQGILFMAMCRYAGIPARWQSGWQTSRTGRGMHDWAEFYVVPTGDSPLAKLAKAEAAAAAATRPAGATSPADPTKQQAGIWLPADPSVGRHYRDHADPKIRDFLIGHIDAYRLIVNSDYGRALWPPKQSGRSEPVDFQRGEIEVDGKNLYFDQWAYHMKLEWLDEGP